MSGFGSGRWSTRKKATTVEESEVLDVMWLARNTTFQAGVSGVVRWTLAEREVSATGFALRSDGLDGLLLDLAYRFPATGLQVTLSAPLEKTFPYFGGFRWWFLCPLLVDGLRCSRRVAKLYLPPGEVYYGCRCCHQLTYESSQRSHCDLRI